MKGLAMTLMAMSMTVGVAMAEGNGLAVVPRTDSLEAAKTSELKGDLARLHDKYSEAIFYYQSALRATGQNSRLYNKLGVAELQLGDRGPARKHFSQAVKYDPRNVAALNNLGAVACMDRKYNPAIKYLKKALALEETNASAHLNMAESWAGLGEMDRAMTEYARALELDADILTSNPEGVVAHVSTPEQRARVSYTIARAYAKRGNLEGALVYLQRARDGHFADLHKVYADEAFAALWDDPRLAKIIKR
jgi:tetratricopeptide (TPR) repeat protein